MGNANSSGGKTRQQPYRCFREDPRYDEIKRMIESFPSEKMEQLKMYIERWLRMRDVGRGKDKHPPRLLSSSTKKPVVLRIRDQKNDVVPGTESARIFKIP